MSSTIKQAIEALKSRVADAYTAIVAKGGTLPATQDSANLPSAIASIPSGGSGLVPILQGGVADAVLQDSSVTGIYRGLDRFYSTPIVFKELNLPNCTIVDAYGGNYCFIRYGFENIKLPSCTSFYGGAAGFCQFTHSIYIEFGSIVGGRVNPIMLLGNPNYDVQMFAYNLEVLKLGNNWDANINIGNWIGDNVSGDTIDQNVRQYIAQTAKDNSNTTAKTITMHPRLYAKLSQATLDIFDSKNWTIALTTNFG